MATIDKNTLDKVFRYTDEEELYDFLKEEVYRNASLAKKLTKRFLPDETACVDFRQEVENVFLCADEIRSKWGPSMDWHQIDSGLWRMYEKAEYLKDKAKCHEAADIACQIISSVGKEYSKDEVFADDSFDGDDFCTYKCVDLLIEMIERDVFDQKKLNDIQREIQKAARMETYADYCICDFDMLLCVLNGELSEADEHLKTLDTKIAVQRYNRDKNKWIMRKASFLQRKGMDNDAASLTEENFGVPEISRRVIDNQLCNGQWEAAIESIGRAIKCTPHDEYSYVNECCIKRIEACEKLGIIETRIEDYASLMRHSCSEEMYGYYLNLKKLMPDDEFKVKLKEIVTELMKGSLLFTHKCVARILAEETSLELLCDCLSINDKMENTEGFEAFKEYASVLTMAQRMLVVRHHVDAIREMAATATSKDYSSVRFQMERLLDCCSEAMPLVHELKKEFQETYKRRHAFMRELMRLDG